MRVTVWCVNMGEHVGREGMHAQGRVCAQALCKVDRVSCEVLWVHMGAAESILDDFTVIDIKCDRMVWCVLISEVHLAELCRGILKDTC